MIFQLHLPVSHILPSQDHESMTYIIQKLELELLKNIIRVALIGDHWTFLSSFGIIAYQMDAVCVMLADPGCHQAESNLRPLQLLPYEVKACWLAAKAIELTPYSCCI